MKRNLLHEKLVWLTDEDLKAINLAVNIAGNLLAQDLDPEQILDLDGDPIGADHLQTWRDAHGKAVDALLRTKYVPEDVLPKLRLILMSD